MKRNRFVLAAAITIVTGTAFLTAHLEGGRKILPLKHTIPYPASYTDVGGAAAMEGQLDDLGQTWYQVKDIYNMTSTGSLTILPHYRTYQQTTNYTCGVSNLIMLMDHYGVYDAKKQDEMTLADATGTTDENGVSAQSLADYLSSCGWNVTSSQPYEMRFDYNEDYDLACRKFTKWVTGNLKQNQPILVDWNDWGGHWQTIIGYDTMGTPDVISDDVLVMADPYDTTDHYQDGYFIVSAERFLKMWTDSSVEGNGGNPQQYIIASPGT